MTQTDKWHEGFPKEVGPYECMVDRNIKTLLHKYCQLNGKHRWMTLQGGDVIALEILWRKKITDVSEIK